MRKRVLWMPAVLMLGLALLAGCVPDKPAVPADISGESPLEGKLIIFHAGSLTVPIEDLTQAFQAEHPGVTVETEGSGSNTAARKISELGREADVMMSADYTVIDKLLIPEFADWNIQFARNTMVIAYTEDSLYADEIDGDNWHEILVRDGVIYGHAEPDVDPCGYRTLLLWQLAERYYGVDDLHLTLDEHCPPGNVRPRSVELIALLQSGDMDYAFEYRSVAVQHDLRFVELPDEVNLSMVEHADVYSQATVEIAGTEPGATMIMTGTPIVYGVTIPKNAPTPQLALEFVRFLLSDEGQATMAAHGQPPIVPAVTATGRDVLPAELQSLVE